MDLSHTQFSQLIARGESKRGDDGYKIARWKNHAPQDVSKLTISMVRLLQKHGQLGAAGKYQLIGSTLDEAIEKLHLSGDILFDREVQEKIFSLYLLRKNPNLWGYLSGTKTLHDGILGAAQVWASIADPNKKGMNSYYRDGVNKASISVEECGTALANLKEILNGK